MADFSARFLLVPKAFWKFVGDTLVEFVVEPFEAFRIFALEVCFFDLFGGHNFARNKLVFFEEVETTFEFLWWFDGDRKEVTAHFWIFVELDCENGHGWNDVFFFVVDLFGLEDSGLAGGRWSNSDDSAVLYVVMREICVDVAEIVFDF